MKYIRIQSYKYDINEESVSFNRMHADLIEAMKVDIESYTDMNDESEWADRYFEVETDEDIKELHEDMTNSGLRMAYQVHEGVSCFTYDKEGIEKMVKYLKDTQSHLNHEDHYILIFEGEEANFFGGPEGEELAKWISDIERIKIEKFINENKEQN